MRWYYIENQVTKGPVEPTELARLASTGVVGPTTPVAEEGATAWRAFAEVVHTISPPPGTGTPGQPAVEPAAEILAVRVTGRVASRLVEPDEGGQHVATELRLEVAPEPDEAWKVLWTELADDEVLTVRTRVGDDHIAVVLTPEGSATDDVSRALGHLDRVNERYRELTERGRAAAAEVGQLLAARLAP